MPVPIRRALMPVATVLLALAGATTAGAATPGQPAGTAPHGSYLDRAGIPRTTVPETAGARDDASLPTFVGEDGLTYSVSPLVVQGNNGTIYIGQDFDSACAYGRKLSLALRQTQRLANVIERTGRRVVFSVAPNKSAVDTADLPDTMPQGPCDSYSIAEQNRILDHFKDPRYVQLRSKMARQTTHGRQLYWKLDTHWNTLATSMYADSVARLLDPQLAQAQSCRPTEETIYIDLAYLGVLGQQYETGPGCVNTTDVRVKPAPGSPAYDPSVMISGDLAWDTKPAKRTWRGKTVLVGDSFTYRGLDNLMPLFRHGHFLWLGNQGIDKIEQAIAESDTVVLESVQRFLAATPMTSTDFRKAVKDAMARYDATHGPPSPGR